MEMTSLIQNQRYNPGKKEVISWTLLKLQASALAGVAHWIELWPVNLRVAGSIPSQGKCLGCGAGPLLGAYEKQPVDISTTH